MTQRKTTCHIVESFVYGYEDFLIRNEKRSGAYLQVCSANLSKKERKKRKDTGKSKTVFSGSVGDTSLILEFISKNLIGQI